MYNIRYNYTTSSVSGQDEPNLRYYWLSEWERRRYLARSGLPPVSRKKTVFFFHINPSLAKLFRSRWLDTSVFILACSWTSTPSRSINTQEKDSSLVNILNVWYQWSIYILLTEFEVYTVSYGPSFSPSIYGPSAKSAGHKS